MGVQKHNLSKKVLYSWMPINPNAIIKGLNSLDSARLNGRLLQNPKTRGFRELFLPKNDLQICSAANFSKKHVDFGSLETNGRHEI